VPQLSAGVQAAEPTRPVRSIFPVPQHISASMITIKIPLDTLSGDPAVVIRTIGIAERTDLVVAMRFEVEDQFKQRTLVFDHDFGDVCLTAASPVVTRRLPLRRFRFQPMLGQRRPCRDVAAPTWPSCRPA
jgi:hypothetical protein